LSSRGRPATGQIRTHTRRDGLTTYSLRLRVNGTRHTVRLGTEAEGWSRPRAELELENVQAKIRAGVWTAPRPAGTKSAHPTLHEFASLWLKRRIADGIAEKTTQDYLWQLGTHILPLLGAYRLNDITTPTLEEFKEHKLEERAHILAARQAGEVLRDRRGQPRRTLSNASINKLLILVTAILENAVRRDLISSNPASGVDRLRTRRSRGGILEADELESLIEGAGDLTGRAGSTDVADRFRAVRELRDEHHLGWAAIAKRMDIAESTAIYRYQRANQPARIGVADPGRRALVAMLGCAGLRVSEAAALDLGDIDLTHRKIRVRDAKTEAGVRSVDVTARLACELRAYLAERAGDPPTAPAFPTRTGNRRDKDNIRERVLAPALGRAQQLRERRGLPPIGVHVTPHTLRRTYISLMLSAGADIPYVQAQVGHRDPKLTLSIYALVVQRRDRREFGDAFDRHMRDAIPSIQHANMQSNRPVPGAA
jgi:integrase